MIRGKEKKEREERREVERKIERQKKFHPPPPVIVNIRVGQDFTLSIYTLLDHICKQTTFI